MSGSPPPPPSPVSSQVRSIANRLRALGHRSLRSPGALAWALAFATLTTLYRARLHQALSSENPAPFGWRPDLWHGIRLLTALGWDLALGAFLAVSGSLISTACRRRWQRSMPAVLPGMAMLFLIALVCLGHLRVVVELHSGLTVTLIKQAGGFSMRDFLAQIQWGDQAFLWFSPVLFFLMRGRFVSHPPSPRLPQGLVLATTALLFISLITVPGGRLAPELLWPPPAYLAADILEAPRRQYLARQNPYARMQHPVSTAQARSLAWIDPVFLSEPPLPPAVNWRTGTPPPTNVLFLILESTGARYVFDPGSDARVPMPFLRELTGQGLWLDQHHATSSSSVRALFSILTGLYPRGRPELFTDDPGIAIPMVHRYLGPNHHTLLVHPSGRKYFFPGPLLENNRFQNIHTRETIHPAPRTPLSPLAVDERDAVDFFIRKLNALPSPFCAVYWSFIPHHPYSDYGPDHRIRPNPAGKRDAYDNNLRVLDNQIRRIFEALQNSDRLEETLVVIAGDHGEGFGQHPGSWGHLAGMWEEIYRAPALLWNPRRVPAGKAGRITTHADLLPSILDAMEVPWNPALIQGESLSRPLRREFVFLYGAQGLYSTAIDRQGRKLSVAYEFEDALAFNLARDPGEMVLLNPKSFPRHLQALAAFRDLQPTLMEAYNESLRKGVPFHGQQPFVGR